MNRYLLIACSLIHFALHASPSNRNMIRVQNLTGREISVLTADFPFSRNDVHRVYLKRLKPRETTYFKKNGPLLGWYQKGAPVGYTVIDSDDTVIYLTSNNGVVKSLHGDLRTLKVTNSHDYMVTAQSKNPNKGEVDCRICAQDCYLNDHTLEYCDCLDYCHDKTRDLTWQMHPLATRSVTVAEGTTLDMYESEIPVYENDDDNDDSETITITRTTVYEIYE